VSGLPESPWPNPAPLPGCSRSRPTRTITCRPRSLLHGKQGGPPATISGSPVDRLRHQGAARSLLLGRVRLVVSADGASFFDGTHRRQRKRHAHQPRLPRLKGYTNYDNYAAVDAWTKIGINDTEDNDHARSTPPPTSSSLRPPAPTSSAPRCSTRSTPAPRRARAAGLC
jgi:hypothetical protein